jgi:methyltransferase family protein
MADFQISFALNLACAPPDSPTRRWELHLGSDAVTEAQLQHRVLESLAGARNYTAWLCSLARPHLGDNPIEVGAGTGDYAATWLAGGLERLTVTEADPQLLAALCSRFAGDDRVTVRHLDVTAAPESDHSALVAFNVLEHIEDDVGALRGAKALVRPGGAIVLFVPAFEFAMSRFDRAIGHYRRYTKSTLGSAFAGAGIPVEELRYVNAPGLLAWLVGMKWLRRHPREGIVLTTWDRLVVPIARRVESVQAPPFGQSLLAVGRAQA